MSSPTTDLPTEVTIPLDFAKYLSEFRPTADGDYHAEQTSFEQIITNGVTRIVADRILADRDRYSAIRKDVEGRIADLVAEKVDARITAALEDPRQPTDGFGNPKGEPTTLNEIILARVDDHLRKMTGDTYGSRQQMTRLDRITSEAIDRKWDAEIRAAIDEASMQVRQKVTERAAEVLTESIKAVTR